MKTLKPLIKRIVFFSLAFLTAVELFLTYNIDASAGLILPVAFAFALLATLLQKQAVHWFLLLFDEHYRKHIRG